MIPDKSHVVRLLTPDELTSLQSEIELNAGLWQEHPIYPKKRKAFQGGKSQIINWITLVDDKYQLQWTFREKFPYTWKFAKQLAQGRVIGKVYWHCLPSGAVVLPHSDVRNPYIALNDCYKRYNIYLDLNKDMLFRFDDTDEVWDTDILQNTLFDISTIKIHSVQNKSQKNMYAMVIDILNDGVVVHEDLFTIQVGEKITSAVRQNHPEYLVALRNFKE